MDINILTVFILAIFVGVEIITKVPPTLHTPLMSGSNAISGIAIVGAIISTKLDGGLGTYLGLIAVVFATVNVVGGFMVTDRMLKMFKRNNLMFDFSSFSYVLAAVLFILGIKTKSSENRKRWKLLAAFGMLIAIVATLFFYGQINFQLIAIGMLAGAIIGATFAIKVEMTQMPQMVAIFNGFGGGASALIASAEFLSSSDITSFTMASIIISIFVGTLTLTGSFIAFGKLQGFISGQPIVFPGQQPLNVLLAFGLLIVGFLVVKSSGSKIIFTLLLHSRLF